MSDRQVDLGIIGLGVMGRNLLLNIADKGFDVTGLDKDDEKVSSLNHMSGSAGLKATTSPSEFVASLKSPRKIMMLVPAGPAVDAVIGELLPLLEEGDLLMDGGNSYFKDTDRRFQRLTEKGLHYMGVGISGGEEGARHGPSIMPGGTAEAYAIASPILEAAAAKANGDSCVTYVGDGSAGHYVKMVHNGIEYAMMQLISESYHLMKSGFGLPDSGIEKIFERWNKENLNSFLMKITADIFAKKDSEGSGLLLNHILDVARQKGTGKWTSQNAMDLQVPVPTIDMAVMARNMSAHKDERIAAEAMYRVKPVRGDINIEEAVTKLQSALYFCFVAAFGQGFSLIRTASKSYGYDIQLSEIAKIWRGGCIIRAAMLEDFQKAFAQQPSLPNLLAHESLARKLTGCQQDVRACISRGLEGHVPVPAMAASISYFDLYKSRWMPVNLVQAQRDYFGSHTYERTDKKGYYHTEWKQQ